MKTISLAMLVSLLALSGLALGSQSGEQKDHSSMMQEKMMMKVENHGKHRDGMMRMMKMMEQCAAMMESAKDSEAKRKPEAVNVSVAGS